MPDLVEDIVRQALRKAGIQAVGEDVPDERADAALEIYNAWIDLQNADPERTVYADQWHTYAFTPGLNPHTWGSSGADWTITNRPVELLGVNQWLGSTPDSKRPIRVRDAAWWNNQRIPDLESTYPTDVYPNYTWPNASLYFWPVPDAAYEVQVWSRIVLAQVALIDSFSLPPGYKALHILSLAEALCEDFGVEVSAKLAQDAADARALVYGRNRRAVPIATRDAGMPHGGRTKTYNYLSREGC